jgi:hypothetical protein
MWSPLSRVSFTLPLTRIVYKEKAHICEKRIEELETRSKKLGYSFFTIDVLWKLVRWSHPIFEK